MIQDKPIVDCLIWSRCSADCRNALDFYITSRSRVLALDKLHQILRSFKVAGNQIESVVDLFRFSYSNNNTVDAGFLALLEEEGPFARDFAGLLVKRIMFASSSIYRPASSNGPVDTLCMVLCMILKRREREVGGGYKGGYKGDRGEGGEQGVRGSGSLLLSIF